MWWGTRKAESRGGVRTVGRGTVRGKCCCGGGGGEDGEPAGHRHLAACGAGRHEDHGNLLRLGLHRVSHLSSKADLSCSCARALRRRFAGTLNGYTPSS